MSSESPMIATENEGLNREALESYISSCIEFNEMAAPMHAQIGSFQRKESELKRQLLEEGFGTLSDQDILYGVFLFATDQDTAFEESLADVQIRSFDFPPFLESILLTRNFARMDP